MSANLSVDFRLNSFIFLASVLFVVLANYLGAFGIYAPNFGLKIVSNLYFTDSAIYLSCFLLFLSETVLCCSMSPGLSLSLEH